MRRSLKIIGWLVAGLLVLAATLPWWLGGILVLVKRPLGLEYQRYELIGYTRFALHGARYQRASVTVTVERVEADTPLLWGWRHLRREPSPLSAKGWRVEVKSSGKNEPDPDAGWRRLQRLLLKIADELERWLPAGTRVEAGEVIFPGGRLGLAVAGWRDGTLSVEGLAWAGRQVDGSAEFISREDLIRLRLAERAGAVQAEVEARAQKISGTVRVWGQPLALAAEFAERGWLPVEGQAVAENWTLDGQKLRLSTVYTVVRGEGRITWRNDGFVIDLAAKGEPVPNENVPPLELTVHGRGDLETLTIETLHAAIPGLDAHLSAPVRLSRKGELLSGPSRLALTADLAQQPWFTAEGRLTGEAQIETGRDFKPRVEVQLVAEAMKIGRWTLSKLQAAGVFAWPLVDFSKISASLGADDMIELSGGVNLETKEVRAATLEARLTGATAASWWPGMLLFANALVTAHAEGPWARLRHSGNAQVVGFTLPPLHPLMAKLDWEGAGDAVEKLSGAVSAGEAQLSLRGAAGRGGARIDELRIQKQETTWLALEKPVRVEWRPQLLCEALVLAGEAGKIELAGRTGTAGEARLQVDGFSTAWLRDWLLWRGPDWRIAAANFSGRWDNGPMEFSLSAVAGTELTTQRPIQLKVSAKGGRSGVKVETLQAFEGQQEALTAGGTLPVTIMPAAHPRWAFDSKAALEFTAATQPDARFWTYLAEVTGLVIERPQMNLVLSGTWQAPRGKIELRLPRVSADPERFKRQLPVGEAINGLIELDRDQIILRQLSAVIDGQKIQLEGHLPMPDDGLSALKEMSWKKFARETTGRLQIPGAELAAFAVYAPALVAPKGRLEADITFAEGQVRGFLRVHDAATRPLGPLGVLQELNADLALVGRGFEIRTLAARMGGQAVAVKGAAELTDDGEPRFDFSLQGENLPFVRQVGLLLRGDLDLKLASTDNGLGRITGKVKLRESLFSTDVRDLVAKGGGGAGAAARPPYFSVEPPPFNLWQLDVDLSGERFLRLRTPVFNGLVSMQFRLSNTLGEPRATGQAVIDEGQVLLPFATFVTRQGSVRLTEANPYEPSLFVAAASRRYGYDLRLEVSGPASAPVLMFSSSPALSSEQVLLLVMTGETPNNETNYSGGQRAAGFGRFIGKSLFSSVSSGSGGAERLEISPGEKISRQGRETYEVEYSLGERWSLVGEYDEFDDYNAGVKWRALQDRRAEEKKEKRDAK